MTPVIAQFCVRSWRVNTMGNHKNARNKKTTIAQNQKDYLKALDQGSCYDQNNTFTEDIHCLAELTSSEIGHSASYNKIAKHMYDTDSGQNQYE